MRCLLGHGGKRAACVKQGDERHPEERNCAADQQGQYRDDAGKPAGVSERAFDFAGADRLADHHGAGIAQADKERKRDAVHRPEDGDGGVVFIAHPGEDDVVAEGAESPERFVGDDRGADAVKMRNQPLRQRKNILQAGDDEVFLERRDDEDDERADP